MELTHHFHVPSSLEQTWAHFQDVAGLAGCFPGAQVLSVDGDDFTGSCKVKLGPIALVYTGSGAFTGRDADDHRLVVVAKGKDKRGNGTASATATLTMTAGGGGGTDVSVLTNLAITGKPAQFGRGLIQDVSDKLLGQFVACLEQQLSPHPQPDDDPGSAPVPAQPATADVASDSRPASPPRVEALDLGATVLPVLVRSYWKPVAAGAVVVAAIVWILTR